MLSLMLLSFEFTVMVPLITLLVNVVFFPFLAMDTTMTKPTAFYQGGDLGIT